MALLNNRSERDRFRANPTGTVDLSQAGRTKGPGTGGRWDRSVRAGFASLSHGSHALLALILLGRFGAFGGFRDAPILYLLIEGGAHLSKNTF